MTDEIVNRILSDADQAADRTESLQDMVREAFSRQMRTVTLIVATFLTLFIALAIWVAVLYFQADETWYIVLYATLFNLLMLAIAGTRIFMWQTLQRRQIQRDIKRLELLMRGEIESRRIGTPEQ